MCKRVGISGLRDMERALPKIHTTLEPTSLRIVSQSPLSRRVFHSSVRRKISPKYTKRGSVEISGQRMAIHIVEVKRERVQKIWKYRYEVVSKDRPDYHNVDWIFSNEQMRDGHYYEVQVNDDMGYPQVLKVIREVDAKELTS